ncbi:U3 small nucleolar RNA-associated protein 4 homolog isoform X1 [Bacillus rossius redtenbacheri]|uniref:U3 small nucleolar RNA-associated protein 4 homolog isoform X1 n=1 Tax=Bacillus rossius redtenbacheri TaxID=93214 RepID=UPI002FDCAD8B
MVECYQHNVRFYSVEPRAIHCVSYEESLRKIALSRADSSVEVWDVAGAPHVQCVLPAGPSHSVEALAWCEGRLFSAGQLGLVREYDLRRLCAKRDVPVTAGPAWCLDVNRSKTQLAVGTENGYVNIFDVAHNELTYLKILDKQEGRILCIAWHPSGRAVVTGGLDAIRIWSVASGHAEQRISVGRAEAGKETVVWCVAVTRHFTIVTGDSRGYTCFWDGNAGAQLDGFCSHKADVLSVCLNEEEDTVYCAGVDPVIVSFSRVLLKDRGRSQWVRSVERRVHIHDVRAMVCAGKCLFSAGVDGYLAVSSYPPKVMHKYPPTLQAGSVQLSGQSRCLLLRYPERLEVWRLGRAMPDGEEPGPLPLAQEPVQLLQLRARPGELLQSAALSPDCRWLALSTTSRLQLYAVSQGEGDVPQLCKSRFQGKDSEPCHAMLFSGGGHFAVLASNAGFLDVYQTSHEAVVWLRTVHSPSNPVLSDTVKLLAVSEGDRHLAAADCSSNIAVWSTASWQVQFRLPRHGHAPTAMSFHRARHLVVVYADQKIVEVMLKTGKFTKFSKRLSKKVPVEWSSRTFPVTNVTFDPRNKNLIILHDDNLLCVINKDEESDEVNAKVARGSNLELSDSTDLDAHASSERQQAFTFRRFKHLVHAQWLGRDELVVVEVSPQSLLAKLPPTLKQKTCGM